MRTITGEKIAQIIKKYRSRNATVAQYKIHYTIELKNVSITSDVTGMLIS
jgi:hypothetical protein